ncbi:hypothetical protein [Corynebacterium sp. sy039]|uniref:ATP-grasp domain-containing protein n=1 Tax=Corynebacterium sp. sy039 TaxID=2599641 RepID=UPI0011B6D204|nr:hypothetical protein [Corynebacterium sp. sy039]QDZ43078.1 hypothetical protein FQV43_07840 [Corynebacterium sp. sy039]
MTKQNILLAIEAMSELDEMASAATKYGYSLRVLAENPNHYGDTCAEIVKFPTRDRAQLENYVKENQSSIAQVFSVTDTWGVIASTMRDSFGYYQFSDTSKLKFFRDKESVQQKLISSGLASTSQDWPKIIKPRGGTGKIGIHLVESEAEMSAFSSEAELHLEDYLEQDFYFGPTYSAEVWRDGSSEILFGITNRILSQPPFFTERVKSFPWDAFSPWEKDVENWVFDILRALDYDLGLAHIEFIETATGFELVEINARMAGALITPGILKTTNFNPYAMAVNQALGAPLDSPTHREIKGGFSHVSLYASQTGTLDSVQGIENIKRYPGNPEWFPLRNQGDIITEVGTYRSRIGNLCATAKTASLAQDRAICAAQSIKMTILA